VGILLGIEWFARNFLAGLFLLSLGVAFITFVPYMLLNEVFTIQVMNDGRVVFRTLFHSKKSVNVGHMRRVEGQVDGDGSRDIAFYYNGGSLEISDFGEARELVTTLTTMNPAIRVKGWLAG